MKKFYKNTHRIERSMILVQYRSRSIRIYHIFNMRIAGVVELNFHLYFLNKFKMVITNAFDFYELLKVTVTKQFANTVYY